MTKNDGGSNCDYFYLLCAISFQKVFSFRECESFEPQLTEINYMVTIARFP